MSEPAAVRPPSRQPLFVPLTRPQMLWGVTYPVFVANLIVTTEMFIITGSLLALALFAIMHVGSYAACLAEPRRFDLWLTRLARARAVPNAPLWRGNSYRP